MGLFDPLFSFDIIQHRVSFFKGDKKNMKKTVKASAKLLGTTLALGLTTTLSAQALNTAQFQINPESTFSISDLSANNLLISNEGAEGACGEGKCGEEAKCGEGKCGEEAKCGESKKAGSEAKCGEGKCGESDKNGEEAKCGEGHCGEDQHKAGDEAKCGEGHCGEDHKH